MPLKWVAQKNQSLESGAPRSNRGKEESRSSQWPRLEEFGALVFGVQGLQGLGCMDYGLGFRV